MEPSIFTKIIRREVPAAIVAEDDVYIAFLTIAPHRTGHTLVVPKRQVDQITDLTDDEHAGLFRFAFPIAKAIKRVTQCGRVGYSILGFEVPHAHLHVIPLFDTYDLNVDAPHKKNATHAELLDVARRIHEAL